MAKRTTESIWGDRDFPIVLDVLAAHLEARPRDIEDGAERTAGGTVQTSNQASGDTPLLSVIVLTFDSEEFIEQCLRSLGPPDRRIETLVIDGGSGDSTLSIVKRGFPGVAVHLAPGSTIPQARNVGLREATGEYVLFLDSDDRLRTATLTTLLEFLAAEAPAFVVTHYARINREGESVGERISNYPDPYGGLLRNPVGTLGMVCRRELLRSLGGFSEAFPVAEDFDLWLRLFEAARGRRLDISLGEHMVREDSASQTDVLRTRIFGVKAVMAAAKRRRTPLHLRVLLAGYWSLFLLDGLSLAQPFGGRMGRTVGRAWEIMRVRLRNVE